MTTFWILAGVMACVGALFVVVPLMRGPVRRDQHSRDQLNLAIRKDQLTELKSDLDAGTLSPEQFEAGRIEIEQGLLEDVAGAEAAALQASAPPARWMAYVLALALPALAVALYLQLGRMDALDPAVTAAPKGQEMAHDIGPEQLAGMVQSLADRLKAQPDDAEGWMMLGRSYAVLRDFPRSAEAYAHAYALIGDHPDVLSNYADALAMANNGAFTDQAVALVDKAVKVDPTHPKALWLAGTAAFERRNYGRALTLWTALRVGLDDGSDVANTMDANIAEVRALMGGAAPPETARVAQAAPAKKQVSGRVRVAPALAAKVDPGATLFVFAKAAQGPPMPLAILRLSAAGLPLDFTLDEGMAMVPAMSLARFDQVMVGARISKSGDATARSGDLQGLVGPVRVGATGIEVVIGEEVK
ncbi:MAG: c-type cytochrome biogenesis protein CcmI [Nitrospirae bacterium]|nr:c-type cytochrome biogenesis protein CcmI [Nitrospirota bacterium]